MASFFLSHSVYLNASIDMGFSLNIDDSIQHLFNSLVLVCGESVLDFTNLDFGLLIHGTKAGIRCTRMLCVSVCEMLDASIHAHHIHSPGYRYLGNKVLILLVLLSLQLFNFLGCFGTSVLETLDTI